MKGRGVRLQVDQQRVSMEVDSQQAVPGREVDSGVD